MVYPNTSQPPPVARGRWGARAIQLVPILLALIVTAWGCSPEEDSSGCTSSSDCSNGQVCIRGECSTGSDNSSTNSGTGGPNNGGSTCPDAPRPAAGQLILNEVLAAVPTDETLGDVNGDGTRDASDDEFLEFVNVSSETLRIGGLEIYKNDDLAPQTTLGTECIEPGQALVLFGGIAAGAADPVIDGVLVEVSDKNLSLTNSGGRIVVRVPDGDVLYDFEYPSASNASVTLDPQLSDGTNYVNHTSLGDGSLALSPGLCADGKALSTGCPTDTPVDPCPDAAPVSATNFVLNEVLAAVPTDETLGDVNGDGTRDASDDEFLEFVNVSDQTINIKGVAIFKGGSDSPEATLQTACLAPGQGLVLFGGLEDGAEPPSFPGALVEIAASSFGLTNSGTRLVVQTPDGGVLYDFEYPSASNASVTLDPQLSDGVNFVAHTSISDAPYSPGACADGQLLSTGCPDEPPVDPCPDAVAPTAETLVVNEVLTAVPPEGQGGDVNGDGVRDTGDDEFIELVNVSDQTLRVGGVQTFKNDGAAAVIQTQCLPPGRALVIIGGLESGAEVPVFGDAIVEVATSAWRFNNGGSTLALRDASGNPLVTIDLPSASDTSLNRSPELAFDGVIVDHATLGGLPYSPGTCANGEAFSEGCPDPVIPDDAGMDSGGGDDTGGVDDTGVEDSGGGDDVAPDTPPSPCDMAPLAGAGDLIVNEVLTDVINDPSGDANGDGVRDASDDEFVELVNLSGGLLRVEGVTVRKDDQVKYTFSGCLEAGEAVVIFGGIEGALPAYAGAQVFVADSAFSFSNSGTTVNVIAADGATTIDTATFGEGPDASFVRQPELDAAGVFTPHDDVNGALFSPGTCVDGAALTTGCP